MEKDLNQIAKIEKAIQKKYGDEAIQNPKSTWTKEKEEKFLKDLKKFYEYKESKVKRHQESGFTVNTKKHNLEQTQYCPTCGSACATVDDDIFMLKFGCCFNCYVQYVEGREERWNSGWRPNN